MVEVGECSVAIYYGTNIDLDRGNSVLTMNLPCYPEEVSNSVEATWNSQSVIGRVGSLNVYTGTSDIQTSFSFDLHREMPVPGGNSATEEVSVDRLIRIIKSGCYPRYGSNTLDPPYTIWKFGDMFISGRLISVHDTWKLPIVKGAYAVCSLSVTMTSATRGIVDYTNVMGEAGDTNTMLPNPRSTFGQVQN